MRQAETLVVVFVLGFAALFAAYGALFGGISTLLFAHQGTLIKVLGVLTIALGLMFMGVLERVPLLSRTLRPRFTPAPAWRALPCWA
ncbi:hypothetical protein SVIO_083660 [Streptomyces violaceusniger]|uniref:Uncharacterized protein n=1 Tax=Streptomyces violaceusniger TaxID=68280 RepID=A0A4D4LI21_STRVO|nr:hypothetical protein SVIO_083660 [Streptomyces violaceusniger]